MVLGTHPDASAPVLSHFSLSGKTALVTGGTRGIGLEVARGLAEAGASVAIVYTSTPDDGVKAALDSIRPADPTDVIRVRAYRCDVTSKEAVAQLVRNVVGDFGQLDIVVVNAGVTADIPALDTSEDEWRTIMKVNLDGAFWTAQAAAKVMERQWKEAGAKEGEGRGSIIFTASVSANLVNIPQRQAAYNTSKAAVVHLAKSLAVEWVDFARVNCISPGFIKTEMLDVHPAEYREKWISMVPGGRFCEPAELKGAYVFLASHASSYMTGANMIIDGGYSLP